MPPEQLRLMRAVLRSIPILVLVFFALLAIGLLLGVGPVAFALVSPAGAWGVLLWRTRDERRAVMEAGRRLRRDRSRAKAEKPPKPK